MMVSAGLQRRRKCVGNKVTSMQLPSQNWLCSSFNELSFGACRNVPDDSVASSAPRISSAVFQSVVKPWSSIYLKAVQYEEVIMETFHGQAISKLLICIYHIIAAFFWQIHVSMFQQFYYSSFLSEIETFKDQNGQFISRLRTCEKFHPFQAAIYCNKIGGAGGKCNFFLSLCFFPNLFISFSPFSSPV